MEKEKIMNTEMDVKSNQIGNISWIQILRLKDSVISKIYIPVLLVTIWTALLNIFYYLYKDQSFINYIFFPESLLTYLGTVFSLLLTFRNSNAYDRYYEGRTIWSNILSYSRHLSRCYWNYKIIKEDDPEREKLINIKIGALRLVSAIPISIKHALRNENKMNYNDLYDLIKHIPRFYFLLKEDPENIIEDLPLKIINYIDCINHVYYSGILRKVINLTNDIADCYTSCRKIIETPIPIIYRIHLKHIFFIYFFSLPLQIIPASGWTSIIISMLTAFTFFGIEAINSEIENPFGYDKNDLLLDDFCQEIQDEINEMMKIFPSSGYPDNLNWLECEKIYEDIHQILDIDKTDINHIS